MLVKQTPFNTSGLAPGLFIELEGRYWPRYISRSPEGVRPKRGEFTLQEGFFWVVLSEN